jgi:hypothetical protein
MKRKGNYKTPFVKFYKEEMAESPLSVRVSVEIDQYVRSLPNRTEWLRKVIEEAVEREKAAL